YFRDKLRSIFEMFDVCIIGHSLADWDLRLILQMAKQVASPMHPIFMILADVEKGEEREYFEKYNIQITSYENADGQHTRLRNLLRSTTPYTTQRCEGLDRPLPAQSADESEAAIALLLYRRLQSMKEKESTAAQYLE